MEVRLFKCRTCLIEINGFVKYASLTDVGDSTRTIKEMIILCVPQMALTLSSKDYVCGNCLESIKFCVKFIESCLEVEAKINKKSLKDKPSTNAKIEIVIENDTKLFDYIIDEHDYVIKDESVDIIDTPVLISDSDDEEETNNFSSQEVGTSILATLLTGKKLSISQKDKPSTSHEVQESTSHDVHENTSHGVQESTSHDLHENTSHGVQESISEEKKHKCTICSKQFGSVKALGIHLTKSHLLTKQDRKKRLEFSCDFCYDSFDTVFKYKEHLKESHKDVEYRNCKPYYCEICNLVFNNKEKIIKHTTDQHGTICTICLEAFPTKETLKMHYETHPDKYVCEICEKGFKKTESLRAHMETHQDYIFKCSVCGNAYKTKSTLRQHMLVHRPDQRVMCDKCPKKFKYMMQLRQHQKVAHDNVKDFKCPECDKSFALKFYLDNHYTLMHIGEKPYQCEFCGKKFARNDYLKNHRFVHTGEKRKPRTKVCRTGTPKKRKPSGVKYIGKPMPCTICGKILKNLNGLKLHLNTHARIRKYPCEICGLKFMNKMVRHKHKATHAVDPENKFVCPVCWKKMKTDEELQLHISEHNNRPKRHVCSVCGEAFSRMMLLENHTFENHTNPEEIELKEKTIIEDALLKVKELFA